jgi:hypothetical protein
MESFSRAVIESSPLGSSPLSSGSVRDPTTARLVDWFAHPAARSVWRPVPLETAASGHSNICSQPRVSPSGQREEPGSPTTTIERHAACRSRPSPRASGSQFRGTVALSHPSGPTWVGGLEGRSAHPQPRAGISSPGPHRRGDRVPRAGPFSATVRDAAIRLTGEHREMPPPRLTPDEILQEGYDSELVQVDAGSLGDEDPRNFGAQFQGSHLAEPRLGPHHRENSDDRSVALKVKDRCISTSDPSAPVSAN